MRSSKRTFTLFELLIVILLIGMAFGALSMKIPKLFENERFEKDIASVVDMLTLAQEIMVDYQADLEIEVSNEKDPEGRITLEIVSEHLLPEEVVKHLKGPIVVPHIRRVLSDKDLVYEGTTMRTPKGVVTLFGKHRTTYLSLKPYPSRIERGDKKYEETQPSYYPQEIVSAL